jgi:hypothetical protein
MLLKKMYSSPPYLNNSYQLAIFMMVNPDIDILNYETALAKGMKMLKMTRSKTAVTQSPSLTARDVKALGYTRWTLSRSLPGFSRILDGLGIRGSNSDFIMITERHTDNVTTSGTLVPATKAEFVSDINVKAGIIVALSNYSPTHEAKMLRWPAATPLPSLKHWSDVAFLQWTHSQHTHEDVRNLNFILRASIKNDNTVAIAESICNALPRQSERFTYPGLYLDINCDEAVALLGTPHGVGVAWLLAQHRHQLGHKVIAGIRMFYGHERAEFPTYTDLNLLFYLRDVSASAKLH